MTLVNLGSGADEYKDGRVLSRLEGPAPITPSVPSLVDALERRAEGDSPWLVFHLGSKTEVLTGRGAHLLARRWATSLQRVGVGPADRALILMPNAPSFVGAFFGAQIIGAVPVPVAWPFAPMTSAARVRESVRGVLEVATPRALLTTPHFKDLALGVPVVCGPDDVPHADDHHPPATSPAFVQFTSGTSSSPRGAVISQRAAVYSAAVMADSLGLEPGQIGVSWLPLFHDMGLVGALLSSLVAGIELHVLTPQEFLLHPDRWLCLASETKARVLVAPNFGYELAARRAPKGLSLDLSSIDVLLDGSEPVQRSTINGFEDRFAPNGLAPGCFRPAYGLAEATLGVCFAGPNADPDLEWEGRSVPSVGRPLAGMSVDVRDELGRVVSSGVEGEINVVGPSLMDGYLDAPAETRRVLRAGCLATGDLGVVSGAALYVTGRKKDLVIKGGQKFHPYEVERIAMLAANAAPNSAVAFGRSSRVTGTEDLVVIVELPETGRTGAVERIRGELLGSLGVRADEVLIVAPGEIPRTTSGKLRRSACATLVEGRL